ncbi:Hypothetical_protein [Hexamita inflata]|uniref:Hypothetical_protein n=1 Tax=Hexamita inflata TaxID=28002 RepID=A0AA86UYP2_9EUKA|nr:Hypothetical protein HINF_LOCUS57298 [Hexamita inflata]CAI9969656.1 Hypothetical protein HINF_LOCUS57301 [Hexamita inflata]
MKSHLGQQKQQNMLLNSLVSLPAVKSKKIQSMGSKLSDCSIQPQSQRIIIQPITFKPREQYVPMQDIHDNMSYITIHNNKSETNELQTHVTDFRSQIEKQTNIAKENLARVTRLLLSSTNSSNEIMQLQSEQVIILVGLKGYK